MIKQQQRKQPGEMVSLDSGECMARRDADSCNWRDCQYRARKWHKDKQATLKTHKSLQRGEKWAD